METTVIPVQPGKAAITPYLFLITLVATLGGLLFGFDMAVISGVLPFVKVRFELGPAAEGWFVSSALLGCILGVALAGELSDRLGRKRMLLSAAFLFLISAAGTASAPAFNLLILARMLGGAGVGVASIIAPLYISEISPAQFRGRMVTFYQLAVTAGILLAYLTNAGLLQLSVNLKGQDLGSILNSILLKDVWRSMLGLGIVPSLIFFTGVLFVPESPRWLIQKGRTGEATRILTRITDSDQAILDTRLIAGAMQEAESSSFRELFTPKLRKPLLLGLLLPLFSQFSGINAVIYYGPRILNDAGIPIGSALFGQILFGLANVLFTLVAIWKVDSMGRRPLYLGGSIGAAIALGATGICFATGHTSNFSLVSSIILFLACFAFSIGPLKFVIATEIFPTALRGRAMGLSILVMWIADAIVGQLTPVLLGSIGAAWTFWFFSACCLLSFVVVYLLLPETKGKTLEEIDGLWKQNQAGTV